MECLWHPQFFTVQGIAKLLKAPPTSNPYVWWFIDDKLRAVVQRKWQPIKETMPTAPKTGITYYPWAGRDCT